MLKFESNAAFIGHVNALRKANPNQWVIFTASVRGVIVSVKAYGTWVQRLVVGATVDGGPSDCSVGDYLAYIANRLAEIPSIS